MQPLALKVLLGVLAVVALSIVLQAFSLPPGNDVLQRSYAKFIIDVLPLALFVTIVLNALAHVEGEKSSLDPCVKTTRQTEHRAKRNCEGGPIEWDTDVNLVDDIFHYRKNVDQASAELGVPNQVPEFDDAVKVVRGYLKSRE